MSKIFTAFLCAALSYLGKAREGLPWSDSHTPSRAGGWFHDRVDEWVENFRGPKDSKNTRLWSCFMAFVVLVQLLVICVLAVLVAA